MAGEAPRLLSAGDVSAELIGSELWHVAIRGQEVVRRIYVAVREEDWGTSLGRVDAITVTQEPDAFRAHLRVVTECRTGRFDWEGVIVGGGEALSFEMRGRALAPLVANRVGICVLHPADTCRGREFAIVGPTGTVTRGRFPVGVMPQRIDHDGLDWSPITDIQELHLSQRDSGRLEFRFDGGPFAFEDQRNYADVTYKSCTQDPPVLPRVFDRPTEIREGVTVTRRGGVRRRVTPADVTVRVDARELPSLPPIGMRFDASHPLDAPAQSILDAVRPRFLRAICADAREIAAAAVPGIPLEIELVGRDEDPAQLDALRSLPRGLLLRTLVRDHHSGRAPHGRVGAVREALGPSGGSVGVAVATLVDLTSYPRDLRGSDIVSWTVNPQVHADDDRSLMENADSIAVSLAAARALAGRRGLCPSLLLAAPGTPDARVDTAMAAAWVLRSVAALASGTRALAASYLSINGPQAPALGAPALSVLKELCGSGAAARLAVTRSGAPDVACLAFRRGNRAVVLAASLVGHERVLTLRLGAKTERLTLEPYGIARRTASCADLALRHQIAVRPPSTARTAPVT